MKTIENYTIVIDISERLDNFHRIDVAYLSTVLRSVDGQPCTVIPERTRLSVQYDPHPSLKKLPELQRDIESQVNHLMDKHLGTDIVATIKGDSDHWLDWSIGNAISGALEKRVQTKTWADPLGYEDLPQQAFAVLDELCAQIDAQEMDDPTILADIEIAARAEESDGLPTTVTAELQNNLMTTHADGIGDDLFTTTVSLPVVLVMSIDPECTSIETKRPCAIRDIATWCLLGENPNNFDPDPFPELYALLMEHQSLAMDVYHQIRPVRDNSDDDVQ